MLEIEYTNQFLKDYKRESKGSLSATLDSKIGEIIDLLCSSKTLPRKFHDHPLKGEYTGTRECHVRPDLLLIYSSDSPATLKLIRLGSHSELF